MDWTPDRIKALRARLGLSQPAFAEALGLNRAASVSDLETGRSDATGPTARLLDIIEVHGPNIGRSGSLFDRLDIAGDEIKVIVRELRAKFDGSNP